MSSTDTCPCHRGILKEVGSHPGQGLVQSGKDAKAFPADELGEKSVHLWRISLDEHSRRVSEYEHLLSVDERDRAARFRFEEDRRRFLVSHGALRTILGSYLKQAPQSILFRTSETGKPELIEVRNDPQITFNMSHSGALALVGVARNRRIGVDVEAISSKIDIDRIAEDYFTREELAALRKKPEDDRYGSFYSLWTCKEAYLKALGCGLSGGLQSFILSEKDHDWIIAGGKDDRPRQLDHWTIRSLKLMDGYAAAVAIDGTDLDIVMVGTTDRGGAA